MKALIISGGNPPSEKLVNSILNKVDIVIGADKGCDTLDKFNIKTDYILGDFDSVNVKTLLAFEEKGIKKYKFKKEKDDTDTKIAVDLAIEKGAKEIYMLGVTGTRLDHTLANIGLLGYCLDKGVRAYIVDENNYMYVTNKGLNLKGKKGQVISFRAYKEDIINFNIKGSLYDLKNYNLSVNDGITTSNEFVDSNISISFDSGTVMIIYTKE